MMHNLILRVVVKLLAPLIVLFALYVQFHGEYSPGGGFQAGVIFSAAFILYSLIFGQEATEKVLPMPLLKMLASLGVLIFAGTGVVAMLLGGNFLEYGVLADLLARGAQASDPVAGQVLGILVIELGVGITVASVMLLIFLTFAGRNAP